MNKTVVYVVALVVVSLIAGTLLGVVLSRRSGDLEHNRRPERSERMRDLRDKEGPGRFEQNRRLINEKGPLEKLSQILNLSLDQKEKLAQILKSSRQEVEEIQHKTKNTFMEIKKKTDAKIREILTPEQQAKFDKLESELIQRMREGERPRFLNREPGRNEHLPERGAEEEYPRAEPRD